MKKTYRSIQTKDYWNERWEKAGVDKGSFQNRNIYPIRYSEPVMRSVGKDAKVLEAGVGSGRLFFHYLYGGGGGHVWNGLQRERR